MNQQDKFQRVLGLLHDAMLDDANWPAAAGAIDDACQVKGNALVVGVERPPNDVDLFFARFCYGGERYEDFERKYFADYHPHDERLPRLRRLPDSHLVHVTEVYTEKELKTSATYNEAMRLGSYQNSLNVRLDGPAGSHMVWGLADPAGLSGWQSAQIRMVESLLPHVRQFVRVRQALADAEASSDAFSDLNENTRVGLICLDWQGKIVEASERAADILRQGDALFDQGGFLRSRCPKDNDFSKASSPALCPSCAARPSAVR